MKFIYLILCASIVAPLHTVCKVGYFSIRNQWNFPIKYYLENEGDTYKSAETTIIGKSGKKIDDSLRKIDIAKPTKLRIWSDVADHKFEKNYVFDPKDMGKAKDIHVTLDKEKLDEKEFPFLRRQKGIWNFSQVKGLPNKSLSNNVTDKDIVKAAAKHSVEVGLHFGSIAPEY